MKRQEGHYWVSLVWNYGTEIQIFWEIAFWDGENWSRTGDDCYYGDNEFVEIDETLITRYNDNNKKVGNA